MGQLTQFASETLDRVTGLLENRSAVRLSPAATHGQLTVDLYHHYMLITDYIGHEEDELRRIADHYLQCLQSHDQDVCSVVAKHRPNNLARYGSSKTIHMGVCLYGERPPKHFTIQEYDMLFEVSFEDAGFGTGLFLDMVAGRQAARDLAKDHPAVLNLFSYSGAFSIAAAKGGAQRVIEVDVYRKWLAWAQRNQQHNKVDVVRQRRDDAMDIVRRADDGSYDMVICDPPSFAKPKRGKPFRIAEAYEWFMPQFVRILKPGGVVLTCCNFEQMQHDDFRNHLEQAMNGTSGAMRFDRWIEPEIDFEGCTHLKVAQWTKA